MKKITLAIVEWEDASTYTNKSEEDVLKDSPSLVRTFGGVTLTKKYCIVRTHYSCLEDSDDFTRIPRSLVKKIMRIRKYA